MNAEEKIEFIEKVKSLSNEQLTQMVGRLSELKGETIQNLENDKI